MKNKRAADADGTTGLKIGGAIAATLAAGIGLFLWREKSVPQPDYVVVDRDGDFEIRDYPELIVAETRVAGAQREAQERGFRRLADYLFARHRDGQKLAMTAPVLNDQHGDGGWRTRFVMPSGQTQQTLPDPDPAVALATIPARRVAVVRFPGRGDAIALDTYEQALREWLDGRQVTPAGPPEYAFYNSPFMPAALRRNEVILPIETS